jgi:hypothetical protein
MKGKIGITIIIVAYLVSLYPYMVIYIWMLYLVGVVFIWMSDLKLLANVLWTILPIALWYPGIFLFYYLVAKL